MRVTTLLLMATLVSSVAAAQTATLPAAPAASSDAEEQAAPVQRLSVSLKKIREALERAPATALVPKSVDDATVFRVEIQERLKFEELLATLDFKSGPTPAGCLYAYEQQRILHPSVDNPLAQPWSAFNHTELLIVSATSVLNSMLANYIAKGVRDAYREGQLQAARANVERAIADYCGSRENGGAGVLICDRARTPVR